jgi:hypothetical protein
MPVGIDFSSPYIPPTYEIGLFCHINHKLPPKNGGDFSHLIAESGKLSTGQKAWPDRAQSSTFRVLRVSRHTACEARGSDKQ